MPEQILPWSERLPELLGLLRQWPGLVSSPDLEIVTDSLALLPHLADGRRVVDVGSGGGLPGLPLKLARPDLELTLIEANHKKAAFLVHASVQLGLRDVEVLAMRAEEAGQKPQFRETFDTAVVRAVAHTAALAELCLPLLKVGGRLLAMKVNAETEVEAASAALAELGGRLAGIAAAPTRARRQGQVVVIEKIAPTPAKYPRRPGVPNRKPLGM